MKKLSAIILCFVLSALFCFVSCGKTEEEQSMMLVRTRETGVLTELDGNPSSDNYFFADVVVLKLSKDETFNAADFTVKKGDETVSGYGFRTDGEYGSFNGVEIVSFKTVKTQTLKKDDTDPLVVLFLVDFSGENKDSITVYYKGKAL